MAVLNSVLSEEDSSEGTSHHAPREFELFKAYTCDTKLTEATLDIVTWNIEFFPKNGKSTIRGISELIRNTNADIIAVQEIAEPDLLQNLIDITPGWNYKVYDVRGGQELGYLYKESEIRNISNLSIIYPDNSSAFYRPPVITNIQHVNGQEITLINIHLKCCGGEENTARRKEASILLKKYIDTRLKNNKVMVLGDFNDELSDDVNNPFHNFIEDVGNYYFADMEIALGPSEYRSYPSWKTHGSHLDHILISNELFDDVEMVTTLTYNDCIEEYESNISDHRPVLLSIK
ncbi:hypothetical protein GCM10011506_19180 [Marivirga lumbricoides]|uniref:Endonuclease/exonuclease/phosphatase domain-containing protein n=1 Tax=Marivirga lumbricoides TaxID=1046115 RepID=A0ABQ1M3V4_9BACT|nr:hypothetical protein GCM10011506_19180 [Marivirga lumbricoides]